MSYITGSTVTSKTTAPMDLLRKLTEAQAELAKLYTQQNALESEPNIDKGSLDFIKGAVGSAIDRLRKVEIERAKYAGTRRRRHHRKTRRHR